MFGCGITLRPILYLFFFQLDFPFNFHIIKCGRMKCCVFVPIFVALQYLDMLGFTKCMVLSPSETL